MNATYSPDDNKLRLYAGGRLDDETYKRVRAAGFRWAPRQELFVAPAWSPSREDLLVELCGEVGDEDTTLAERAEERADRFDQYSTNRLADANQASDAVSAIADHIPLGQPILVGHHSEKHARRDAEKIDNGMRRAVRMWETSEYWTRRADGALRHANYKERPEVRARRIKKIEAERRALVRTFTPKYPDQTSMQEPWYCPVCDQSCHRCDHPEASTAVPHVYCGASRGGSWVPVSALPARERGAQRWLAHYDNRLAYERAMLGEQGRMDLLNKPKRPKPPPLLNYQADELQSFNKYRPAEARTYRQVECTKAVYAKVPTDYKCTRLSCDKSHRFRTVWARCLSADSGEHGREYVAVFLTDSKVHPKPALSQLDNPVTLAAASSPAPRANGRPLNLNTDAPNPNPFEAMRETLRNGGVQTVVASSLFPTPPELARRVIEEADIQSGQRVLEPSAGTGNLIRAVIDQFAGADCGRIVAVEHNPALAEQLREQRRKTLYANESNFDIRCTDFMTSNGDLGAFDRVVMNPPFERGQDAEHVRHAFGLLKPGGRLVAIMSPGPFFRQASRDQEFREWFDEVGGVAEDLPAGSFKASGTNVETKLVVIDKA